MHGPFTYLSAFFFSRKGGIRTLDNPSKEAVEFFWTELSLDNVSSDPLSHLSMDFLWSKAALYKVFMLLAEFSFTLSGNWMALSLDSLMLTRSDSFARFGLWNSTSSISHWICSFMAFRLHVFSLTLFSWAILSYAACSYDIFIIFPLFSIACPSLLSTAVESLTRSFSSPSIFTALSRELPAEDALTMCKGCR